MGVTIPDKLVAVEDTVVVGIVPRIVEIGVEAAGEFPPVGTSMRSARQICELSLRYEGTINLTLAVRSCTR